MGFKPGTPKPPKSGRKPGVKNHVTADAKLLMDALVEHGLRDATQVYDRIKRRAPARALTVLARFAEYRLPKLARTEVTGPDGGPQVIEKRVYVSASTQSEADQVAAALAKHHEE